MTSLSNFYSDLQGSIDHELKETNLDQINKFKKQKYTLKEPSLALSCKDTNGKLILSDILMAIKGDSTNGKIDQALLNSIQIGSEFSEKNLLAFDPNTNRSNLSGAPTINFRTYIFDWIKECNFVALCLMIDSNSYEKNQKIRKSCIKRCKIGWIQNQDYSPQLNQVGGGNSNYVNIIGLADNLSKCQICFLLCHEFLHIITANKNIDLQEQHEEIIADYFAAKFVIPKFYNEDSTILKINSYIDGIKWGGGFPLQLKNGNSLQVFSILLLHIIIDTFISLFDESIAPSHIETSTRLELIYTVLSENELIDINFLRVYINEFKKSFLEEFEQNV